MCRSQSEWSSLRTNDLITIFKNQTTYPKYAKINFKKAYFVKIPRSVVVGLHLHQELGKIPTQQQKWVQSVL